MQNRHTKGPWDFDRCDYSNGRTEFGIFQPAERVEGETVDYLATVHSTVADARIMTEAPAMLAALRRIVQWVDAGCDPSQKSLNNARAILARIDGEGGAA